MFRHKLTFIIRWSTVITLAIVTGILLATGHFWLATGTTVVLFWQAYYMWRWINRMTKDMKRFIEAIRFNELNISFYPAIKKGLPEELAHTMEESLALFRER